MPDKQFDDFTRDETPHFVVEAAACQNHLRVIAKSLRCGCQVIGIDTNAMSSHQTRCEFQKIPFGTGGFKYILGAHTHSIKNDRQFVHQGNVDISLGVFQNLCGLSHFNGGGLVQACMDDSAIDVAQP